MRAAAVMDAGAEMMPGGAADLIDVLFVIVAAGVATVLGGCAFVAAVQAWRDWSANRRIRKHLRN